MGELYLSKKKLVHILCTYVTMKSENQNCFGLDILIGNPTLLRVIKS